MYALNEARNVFFFDKPVFHEFRASHDGMERRHQFVRYVRRKFASVAFGKDFFGHVENEQDDSCGVCGCSDTARIQLIYLAFSFALHLRVSVGFCVREQFSDFKTSVNRQKILAHAGLIRSENTLRRGIDAQHRSFVVQKDKSLFHAFYDGVKLRAVGVELSDLTVDKSSLLFDLCQHRRKFVVSIVVERLFEVDRVERLDDLFREPAREQKREYERDRDNDDERLDHSENDRQHRQSSDRDAEHRSVLEKFCVIDGLFRQRLRITRTFSDPRFECFGDLFSVFVVFHIRRVALGIKKHRSVCGDPCEAVVLVLHGFKILKSVFFDRRRRKRKRRTQVFLLI